MVLFRSVHLFHKPLSDIFNITFKLSDLHERLRCLCKMEAKSLAVFDFDHTIVDGNSDVVVRNLLHKEQIPENLKKLYKDDGWTTYMQGVFELLHIHGYDEKAIAKSVSEIAATEGMPELIKSLHASNYDVIIISDSNSFLIETWLNRNGLRHFISRIFTNPARFVNSVLRIEKFHLQLDCNLSTKNLCKGKIMEDFIAEQKQQNVNYDQVLYAGDGNNDFCPILRLRECDIACVRDKYACQKLVANTMEGKPIASTGKTYQLRAHILVWNTGYDILNSLST